MNGKLDEELKDKEYRHAYIAAMNAMTRAYQVEALRAIKGWTQTQLAETTGKHQSVISRLEDPDYENCETKTIADIAAAFDVAWITKLVPFSKFTEECSDLSREALYVKSFEEELESANTHGHLGNVKIEVPTWEMTQITTTSSVADSYQPYEKKAADKKAA